MKKSRFTDEQIIDFLRQAESSMPVKELCRLGASAMRPSTKGARAVAGLGESYMLGGVGSPHSGTLEHPDLTPETWTNSRNRSGLGTQRNRSLLPSRPTGRAPAACAPSPARTASVLIR